MFRNKIQGTRRTRMKTRLIVSPSTQNTQDSCDVYSNVLPIIDDLISDPDSEIIIKADGDGTVSQLILSYLNVKQYRTCTVFDVSTSDNQRYKFPVILFDDMSSLNARFFLDSSIVDVYL